MSSIQARPLVALAFTMAATVVAAGCPGPSEPSGPLSVEGMEIELRKVTIGDPVVVEARVVEADGSPAVGYDWRWSIESFGHMESAEHSAPNVERVTITPTAEGSFTVWGQMRRGDGSFESVEGPTLAVWGAEPAAITTPFSEITLAVGERRPIVAQGIGTRMRLANQVYARGHDPVTYASSDSAVVTVSEHGLLEAKSAGEATIEVAYAGMTEQITVRVDEDLVVAAPGREPSDVDIPVGGMGVVDDRGYPVFFGQLAVAPFGDFNLAASGVSIASWTGTNVGLEMASRPWDAPIGNPHSPYYLPGYPQMLRGAAGNLWVVYESTFPTPRIVVAHRPIDGTPADWVHADILPEDVDIPELRLDSGLDEQFGVRARPDGGIWVAFGMLSQWSERQNPDVDDRCAKVVVLATVGEGAPTLETVVEDHDELVRLSSGPNCPYEAWGARRPDFDEQGRYAVVDTGDEKPEIWGIVRADRDPSRAYWDGSLNRWRQDLLHAGNWGLTQVVDPDDPGRRSMAVAYTNSAGMPIATDDADLSIGLARPSKYAWGFFLRDTANIVSNQADSIAQWTVQADGTIEEYRVVTPWTTEALESLQAWAFGAGRAYTGGSQLVDATPPLLGDPRDARDVDGEGYWLAGEATGRPIAYADGHVLVRGAPLSHDIHSWDSLDGSMQTLDGEQQNNLIYDPRAVEGTLYTTINDGFYASVDDGQRWLRQGSMADAPRDPWAMYDEQGRRHVVRRETATGQGETLVWEVFDADDNLVASKQFAGERNAFECLGDWLEARHFVTRTGTLVVCHNPQIVDNVGWAHFVSTATLDDDALTKHFVGIGAFDGDIADRSWELQIGERADGRAVVGFTGVDPSGAGTRAVIVEQDDNGDFGAPIVLRAEGGYQQFFAGMEPLPDGRLAVLAKDVGYLLLRVDNPPADAELKSRWDALVSL